MRSPPLLIGLIAAVIGWPVLQGMTTMFGHSGENRQLPMIALPSTTGRDVELSTFVGRPSVVNLWASWCPPCQREMPVLVQAQRQHPGINFVFVDQGEKLPAVQWFMSRQQGSMSNVLLDSASALSAHFGTGALPATLFFDAQGHLVDRYLGALSKAALEQRLEAMQPPDAAMPNPKPSSPKVIQLKMW